MNENQPKIWKLAHSHLGAKYEEALKKRIACLGKETGPIGGSKTSQSKNFEDAKKGDYFFLLKSSSEIELIGRFLDEETFDTEELHKDYFGRKYEKVFDAKDRKINYSGKWWAPSGNNTFVEVPKKDYLEFEEKILEPNFYKNLEHLGIIIDRTKNNNSGENSMPNDNKQTQPLNQILYGPPGTGKTYHTNRLKEQFIYTETTVSDFEWAMQVVKNLTWFEVVALCLYDLNQVAKVPDIASHELVLAKANILNKEKGIPQQVWAALQTHTVLESQTVKYKTRVEPYVFDKHEGSLWKFVDGFEETVPELITLYNQYKKQKPASQELHNYEFVTFHQSYGYEEFIEGIKAIPIGEIGNEDGTEMIYKVTDGIFKKLADRAKKNPEYNFAIFIDEVNRGNISKIFGELITLIEDNKRLGKPEEMKITLPYSGKLFGVPSNLYIIGTMNTADRSIALMDTALRRRFDFTEMMPDLSVLEKIDEIDGVNIKSMLEKINKRVEYLYDRDHTIGHAYFMSLKKNSSLGELENIFRNKIIPLLQEYFYDDWEKIRLVLGDNQKGGNYQFIKIKKDYDISKLFGNSSHELLDDDETKIYEINNDAFKNIESYKKIYETK